MDRSPVFISRLSKLATSRILLKEEKNNSNKSVKVDSIINPQPSSDDSLIPSTSSLNDVIPEHHIGSDDQKYKRLLKKYRYQFMEKIQQTSIQILFSASISKKEQFF